MLRSWLRSMIKRKRLELDMEDELRFHIESYAEDLCRQGVPKPEAWRRAKVEFGGVEAHKEECRESLGLRLWDEFKADLRSGGRVLRQSPVFTAVAVISLALGIGSNTAIFTLANEVLLRTMAVPNADRLRMFMWAHGPNAHPGPAWGTFDRNDQGEMIGTPFPYLLYLEMKRHNEVMEELVAFKDIYQLSATVDGRAEAVSGMLVSGNFYPELRARVEAGRGIVPGDDAAGAIPVALISDAFWARRFGRSLDVLGKTIDLNRTPVTIVGVNAPEFGGPKAGNTAEVFFPLALQQQVIPNPKGSLLAQDGYWWLAVLGRLKPGVTDKAANAALSVAFRDAFHKTIPERKDSDMPRFFLRTGARGLDLQKQMEKPIYLLLSIAGLVLLIACANLANLLLARAAVRQREISLRLAMGAGRMRIMRQILTESMLLALLGGAAGLMMAYAGHNFIPALFDEPRGGRTLLTHLDWRVFAFSFSITVATGLLFGIGPAWQSTRADQNSVLKENTRMSSSRPKVLFGKLLVIFQVGLSLVLLIGAGLFTRTLWNLRAAPTGINPEHIVLFQVTPPQARYTEAQRVILFRQIAEGLATIPGVEKVTSSSEPLLANSMDDDCFRPSGMPTGAPTPGNASVNYVGPEFFETYAIRIVQGRTLLKTDQLATHRVAILNRTLAKIFFPDTNAVGRTISACNTNAAPIEVVGISADAKYSDIREAAPPTAYFPYSQADDLMWMTFEVKTAASLGSLTPRFRDVVKVLDKDLPILDVRTQAEQIEEIMSQERVFATLTSGFGVLALLLASVGIYGVMAYTVEGRTNEIGIRMALGAEARWVLAMVLGETSVLAVAGIGAGVLAALAATKLVTAMLFGVKATDPLTFLGGAGLLFAVAITAALIPAWRAARVDPMNALRHE